jgi:hypothetical protein
MSPHAQRNALALVLGAFALVTLVGIMLSRDLETYFQLGAIAVGLLMLAGSCLVHLGNRFAVALLLLSAGAYFLLMVIPGTFKHGIHVFETLMPAFYFSVATRLALAGLAFHVLTRSCARA